VAITNTATEGKLKKNLISFLLILLCGISYAQNIINIETLIEKGDLSTAKKFIKSELVNNDTLSQAEVKYLKEELNRIEAITNDYPYAYDEIFTELKKRIPDLTKRDIEKWEENTTLEYRVIDGKKMYFWAFSFNLFALNKEAEKRRIREKSVNSDSKQYDHIAHKKSVISAGQKSKTPYILPKEIRVSFTFFEDVSDIPEGEIVRGWLPIPRETLKQRNIRILEVEPDEYIVSNKEDYLNASIYVEKPVIKSDKENDHWKKYFADPPEKWIKPLSSPDEVIHKNVIIFRVVFEYTAYAYYRHIDPQKISTYDTSSVLYKKYIREELPHIKFTDYLSKLSKDIVEDETNNYLKARKIYEWICKNIIWTNPDYSSPNSLSEYIAKTKRGDCGSKALLFITLCRLNRIPARFQGGWMTQPFRGHSQHGWAQIYIEPYGWLTVDPDAGSKLINSEDERLKYFHFGNCDSYRLIIYDDNSPLFPHKIYGYSSGGSVAAGLQLGAFEWSGGELESNVKIDTDVEE
jgi:transglutaminase-like putative cysteine protease